MERQTSVDDYHHNTLAQVSHLASITADLAVQRPDLNPQLPPKKSKAGGWFQQLKPFQKYLNAATGEHIVVGKYTVYIRNQVAEGGYGVVFRCKEVGGQERACALKRILIPRDEKEALEVAKREISALEELGSHSNVVQLLASSVEQHATKKGIIEVLVLMEWCRGGNMMDYAIKMKDLPIKNRELAVLRIFSDACRAVAHLHMQKPPLQHRDLKPENYILAADGSWKLCDFGSSTREVLKCETRQDRLKAEDLGQRFTSATIRPPELWEIYDQTIDAKVDIWGLGCILYALAFGAMPFDGEKLAIVNVRFKEPSEPNYSLRFWEMLRSMLSFDPKDRPAIGKICEWVANAIHLVWAEENPEIGAGLQDQQGVLEDVLAKRQAQLSQAAATTPVNPAPVSQPDWNAFPEDELPAQAPMLADTKSTADGEVAAKSHGSMNPIGGSTGSDALRDEDSSKAFEKDKVDEGAETVPKDQSEEKAEESFENDEPRVEQNDSPEQEESLPKSEDEEEGLRQGVEIEQTAGKGEATGVEDQVEESSLEVDEVSKEADSQASAETNEDISPDKEEDTSKASEHLAKADAENVEEAGEDARANLVERSDGEGSDQMDVGGEDAMDNRS